MAFCKTCGTAIPDGQDFCANCAGAGSAPVSGRFTPISDDFSSGKKGSKKGIFIGLAAIVALVVGGVFLFNLIFAGYKKPIKNVVKGINKIDIDKMVHAFIPKDQIEDFEEMIEDEKDEDYKDYVKEAEESIEEIIKDNKVKHKVKVDFEGKKKVKGNTLKAIENTANIFFEHLGLDEVDVKKAYRVKVELEADVKYKKEKAYAGLTFNLYVVKYKGCSGWYLAPYIDKDSLGEWSDLVFEVLAPYMMGVGF